MSESATESAAERERRIQRAQVGEDDAGVRLDKWLRQRVGKIPQSRIEGLLRRGRIRVQNSRARAGQRLNSGEEVSWPSALHADDAPRKTRRSIDPKMLAEITERVIHQDDHFVAVNKPAGLAVQGGSKQRQSLDAILADMFSETPRLLHRLDRGTSGVVLFARSPEVARAAMESFRLHEVFKVYWAVVAGAPAASEGQIDLPLAKSGSVGGQKMRVDKTPRAKHALTLWVKIGTAELAGNSGAVSWLALAPVTGRMHQLRVHLAEIGAPVLGDGKYGGRAAFPPPASAQTQNGLLLFARRLILPDSRRPGEFREFIAPPPPPFADALAALRLAPPSAEDPVRAARVAEARLRVLAEGAKISPDA
ncbi:MAG: RluA family pseudouridine synthase [Alphaproteobacteria bacterium]|nr:RluA family pseudouridine synthase [Alphaproteobacteria bacterium]